MRGGSRVAARRRYPCTYQFVRLLGGGIVTAARSVRRAAVHHLEPRLRLACGSSSGDLAGGSVVRALRMLLRACALRSIVLARSALRRGERHRSVATIGLSSACA